MEGLISKEAYNQSRKIIASKRVIAADQNTVCIDWFFTLIQF